MQQILICRGVKIAQTNFVRVGMGLPDHPWILLFSGRSRTPVPTRSTVILALPSLPKGGWRGEAVTGGYLRKAAQPINFCKAKISYL